MKDSHARKWVIVAYDLPNEPSKLKVRAWRSLKKLGAVYPSLSLCILPETPQTEKEIGVIRSDFGKYGRILVLNAGAFNTIDDKQLSQIFLDDRRKQFEEIFEECEEFLDEIKENIAIKKTTYEETDELEQALEGLERWYQDILRKGHGRAKDAARVERILEKCRKALSDFAERSQPRELNKRANAARSAHG